MHCGMTTPTQHSTKVRTTMQYSTFFATARRLAVASSLFAVAALTACSGSGGAGGILGGLSNNAYIRVINGSPDAGTIDVTIDGNVKGTNLAYGAVGVFNSFAAGTHTANVYHAGNDNGTPLATGQVSINGAQDYTVVVTGEVHPSYQASTNLGFETFTEQPFNTSSAGGALNYHNASPFVAATGGANLASVQFGYSLNSAPANMPLGSPVGNDAATNPQPLPSNAINTPITLYGQLNAGTTITTTPGQINTNCTNNQIPCTTSSLSLYLIDGPAASTQPVASVPVGASPQASFAGIFDANGLITP